MTESDSSTKKVKKWYQQQFKATWLEDPSFKSWLRPEPGNSFGAICIVCDCKLKNPNKSALRAHQKSTRHTRMAQCAYVELSDGKKLCVKREPARAYITTKKKIKSGFARDVNKAELLLCAFVTEHSLPYTQAEQLVELIKKMLPDSAIAQKLTMSKIRASYNIEDETQSPDESMDFNQMCETNNSFLSSNHSTSVAVHGIDMTEEVQGAMTALKNKLRLLSDHLATIEDPTAVIECLKAMSSIGVVIERYKKLW